MSIKTNPYKWDYFRYVQRYQHHTGSRGLASTAENEMSPIQCYSFALNPEEHQPSGTCNFSRIDNANLFLTVTSQALEKNTVTLNNGLISVDYTVAATAGNAKVRVYAVNYNVLRIMSGMGGLAYSN